MKHSFLMSLEYELFFIINILIIILHKYGN